METERVLAKLRRLRYRSDYPLRLFLAAMGEGFWPEGTVAARAARRKGWSRSRRQPSRVVWHLASGRCPRCGHPDRETGRRGGRIN